MDTEPAHHCVFDTPIGPCGVAWSTRGLIAVQLPEADEAKTEKRLAARAHSAGAAAPPPWVAAVIADIKRYLAGEHVDFSAVDIDLSGLDPFRRKIYGAQPCEAGYICRACVYAVPAASEDQYRHSSN